MARPQFFSRKQRLFLRNVFVFELPDCQFASANVFPVGHTRLHRCTNRLTVFRECCTSMREVRHFALRHCESFPPVRLEQSALLLKLLLGACTRFEEHASLAETA